MFETLFLKKSHKKLLFSCLFFLYISVFTYAFGATGQERLEYKIQVNAHILPIFAVDSNGNPVYGIKEEELDLYVNGKPRKVVFFQELTYEDGKSEERIMKPSERIVIIILDSVNLTPGSNTFYNFGKAKKDISSIDHGRTASRRAKKIAVEIIKNAAPGDSFIILESSQYTGLSYSIGPEKEKEKLFAAIKRTLNTALEPRYIREGGQTGLRYSMGDPASYASRMRNLQNLEIRSGKLQYEHDIKTFSNALYQLKYALKSITLPKIVFLISGGIPNDTFNEIWTPYGAKRSAASNIKMATYYDYLKNSAKAINFGGSMLYIINPVQDTSFKISSRDSLKYMADTSGGRYFGGSDIDGIVTRLKKSTAAYYEIAFYPNSDDGKKVHVKIDCKRKGVTLNTINFSEKGTPYKKMESIQKKLFALNVVNKGSWSKIIANIRKIKYKKIKSLKKEKYYVKNIKVNLPEKMKNRELDIYTLNIDPTTAKAKIAFAAQEVTDMVKIRIQVDEGKKQYFVIIEPEETYCIYNQIK